LTIFSATIAFENSFFVLGSVNVESTIKSMQRQLLQISDKIPDEFVLTLLKCFAKILSREPEPAPKTPFLRAFAKICEDNSIKPFSRPREEKEGHDEFGQSDGENECSYESKLGPDANIIKEEFNGIDVSEEIELEITSSKIEDDDDEALKKSDVSEDLYENNLSEEKSQDEPRSDVEEQFESLITQEKSIDGCINETNDDNLNIETDNHSAENDSIQEPAEKENEEIIINYEPIPTEPPTVSLDDIEREIQEMQNFLICKGVKPENKIVEEEKEKNLESDEPPRETKFIEDSFNVDVCIKLKNRQKPEESRKHHKKHSHSKYTRSEIIEDEIFNVEPNDMALPTTTDDLLNKKVSKKKQKAQALDVSWQNLCENQKRLYK
jgi:hypothetical protein